MANNWNSAEALPDGLDVTQAAVYREVEPAVLGGRHLAFPGQVWWEKPDGMLQLSVFKEEELRPPHWVRVEA